MNQDRLVILRLVQQRDRNGQVNVYPHQPQRFAQTWAGVQQERHKGAKALVGRTGGFKQPESIAGPQQGQRERSETFTSLNIARRGNRITTTGKLYRIYLLVCGF